MADRHNGAVRIELALVVPCLVTCAAGLMSCGGGDSNPSDGGIDATNDGGGHDTSGGLDSKTVIPDASAPDLPGIEAWGPEAAAPVDVTTDQSVGGDSATVAIEVGPDVATVVADAAIVKNDAPSLGPDSAPNLRVDAGVDTRDASGPEATPVPDAPSLEASAPDAKVDAAAPDAPAPGPDAPVVTMDAAADSSTLDAVAKCGRINCDCTFNGKQLWGDVEIVTSFPDFKVRISDFPDLNVEETYFPSSCGQWHTVTAFGDFTVQFVDAFEDFDIAYSSFPGIAY
jgi:hypothetical protein